MAMSRVHTDCDDSILWRSKYFRIANQVLSWEEKELIQLKDLDEHNDVFYRTVKSFSPRKSRLLILRRTVKSGKTKYSEIGYPRNSPLFAGSGVLFIETMTGIVESMGGSFLTR